MPRRGRRTTKGTAKKSRVMKKAASLRRKGMSARQALKQAWRTA